MITPSFSLTATERVLPRLALDFTTAALDPRITFTRTTSVSNPATYVNSNGVVTAATNNEPRFGYDPITLACKGLLIEESRINISLQSETFHTASWVKTRCSITQNAVNSPAGTLTADKQVEDSSVSSDHRMQQLVTVTTATNYTASVFLLAGERTVVEVLVYNGASFGGATINLSTGVASAPQTGGTTNLSSSTVVTAYSNGWYRVAIPITTAGTSAGIRISLSNGTSTTYTGNGTSGAYVWGAQLEAGAFATSYIPTTTTALTRNADVATMTGTNFSDWWQATTGGVVARVLLSTVSGTRPLIQFDDTTADEIIMLRGNTTNPELYIVDGGSPQAQIDAGTIAANTAYNLGATWNTDDCAAAVNGGSAVTDTTATIPTVTQARLGSDGTNYLNGHLQTIRYWPQRITNAETQAFSK
jgi:hypothetical protein